MELPPGFRFHPTDEELITHYLSPKVLDSSLTTKVIGEVDLNKVEPWDLPWKVKIGEKEWYFFCVRERKYPSGTRANRATDAGYWKATGKDKEVFRAKMVIGMKKTLVFYMGRAPKGEKTNWVMHEYRLEGEHSMHVLPKCAKNEWVICRVFKKSSGGKKVHLSGLVRRANLQTTCLPGLMDLSSCNDQTRTSEGSDHVTCFSNSVKFSDEFCPSQGRHKYDSTPCTESLCRQDSVLVQDESMLQLLLETNGPSTNQNGVQEISQEIGMNMDAAFAISNQGMVGFRPFEQELPFISSGQVHLDCLWDL